MIFCLLFSSTLHDLLLGFRTGAIDNVWHMVKQSFSKALRTNDANKNATDEQENLAIRPCMAVVLGKC